MLTVSGGPCQATNVTGISSSIGKEGAIDPFALLELCRPVTYLRRIDMKVATFIIIALFVMSSAALAISPTSAMPVKADQMNDPGKPDSREGGETIADAWVIYALPFNDTGNTSDNVNDYDEICPFSGSTSPDVVYAYEPPTTCA
jgi:hypothetical protein